MISIDIYNFKSSRLSIEEYFLLAIAVYSSDDIPVVFDRFKEVYLPLQEKGLVKILEDSVEIRQAGTDLMGLTEQVNFDEFWEAFPVSTPSGRPLRPANKEWRGDLTRDYRVCKKKYLSKVKNKHTHEAILQTVKGRVASGDYEYINNLETYINQQKWQTDFGRFYKRSATGTNSKFI